ncbi:zinc-dependent metalloprotease [Pseudoalteromonas sp. MMG005]|uniref:zinc-dependent metalloprotease n=1 Tax=Pseudoalteromonas sp. MMG005 TaxID=2822682 RepID=UPI001B3A23BB|nr:zinc-dependent metalloprotease [Pseudoalteromonas sp. MMG005]MBQ4845220.1 zinc-dependent metalloprotease [Pseudoalteromonas sp. MMG005]
MTFHKKTIALGIAACISTSLYSLPAYASDKQTTKAENKKQQTIADLTKNHTKHEGLFTLFQSNKSGAVLLQLNESQLNSEFIHFAQILDGSGDFGFRGNYRGGTVYTFNRVFNRIEIRAENQHFYFDPNNAVSGAKDANINRPIVASVKIKAHDEKSGDILIDAKSIFLTEALKQIKPSKNPKQKPGKRRTLGKLSKDKTKYLALHNYPKNTDLSIEYVYDNGAPVRPTVTRPTSADFAFTDDRSINIHVRHSLVPMPENSFKARFDDPRIGYFGQTKYDMTSLQDPTPYRDVINRWHLEKKDPNAAVSEPIEPIVWWIENTTPLEYRDTIKQAALAWNPAFEKAGFKNAIVVKIQPDDAKWDAGDLRYNVMRWTSSPKVRFSGYGPSFANPKTGQILGSDIMLELSSFRRRLDTLDLFSGTQATTSNDHHDHSALFESAQFGQAALNASSASSADKARFISEYLHYLVLHEVGHTLGLNHNMRSSQLHSKDKVQSIMPSDNLPLTGSVMEYPAINFAPHGKKQGLYYTTMAGPYDNWAIEYGYSSALDNAHAEQQRLNKILARSTELGNAFGNDADDMRAPGKAIDPRVNIYDLSNDAIGYATDRLETVNILVSDLLNRSIVEGESYQGLVTDYALLNREYHNNVGVISRYIGGVYVERDFAGQKNAKTPFTPVPEKEQRRAMQALSNFVFAPNAFSVDQALAQHLQTQRRFFFNYSKTEDPKFHDMALRTQKSVLNHVLHPVVLKRIVDTELYGNEFKLDEVFAELTNAIFKVDARKDVNSFRRNLQREYVNRLIKIANNDKLGASQQSIQAMARYNLKEIKDMIKRRKGDTVSAAHKEQLIYLISKTLNPNGKA